MRRLKFYATLVIVTISFGSLTGCGGGTSQQASEEVYHNAALEEVGSLYGAYLQDSKKPPGKLADLAKYEIGMPTGYKELREGNIVVIWGAPITPGTSNIVLAYEKSVPESGGYVLMQDGTTVKKMTAQDFTAATKATKGG